MTDKILDDTLKGWKDGRIPPTGKFSEAADFEEKFFARAAQEEALRAALKKRRMRIWAFAAVFVLAFVVVITTVTDPVASPRRKIHAAERPEMPVMKACEAPTAAQADHDKSFRNSDQALESSQNFKDGAVNNSKYGNILFLDCQVKGIDGSKWAAESYYMAPKTLCFAKFQTDPAPNPNRSAKFDTEEYKHVDERPFLATATNPLSTFGADVDTAGYATLRRMILQENRLPTAGAVRLEELINYFRYDYPTPEKGEVLRPCFEMGAAPWNPAHKLLLVGVQARVVPKDELPPSHYVFLIDNSGSMYNVFPMVKEAMTALAKQLRPCDRVSMITDGGGVEVLLEGCGDVETLCRKIDALKVGGYTPGGEGIQTAYKLARKHFIKGGNNRIVLITDGDFNVGASSEAELVAMVEKQRSSGIYLSVAGCGMGNYKDNKVKMLANKGNGNYFYLDTPREAKRAFVHGMTGNMYTLAKDVKFQLEFNPDKVFAYRLIGYELRRMNDRDFRDDATDSGEVGIGQQVTALYEIVPADAPEAVKNAAIPGNRPLKYTEIASKRSGEFLTFRMRYQKPQGKDAATEKEVVLTAVPDPRANWQWAAGVAEFGLVLRNSKIAPKADAGNAFKRLQANLGSDPDGSRTEFLLIVKRAVELKK